MEKILGLDLGTTSVGFALIEYDESRDVGRFLHTGVRIFPEGVTEKDQEPRNKATREARLSRRQTQRRKLRRYLLGRTLAEAGMLPEFTSDEWHKVMATDPYDLRLQAVEEGGKSLTPMEVGRALYHLSQRRGFWSARTEVANTKQEADDRGKVDSGIAETEGLIGSGTLGTALANLPDGAPKRGHYLSRAMIEAEFARIWKTQSRHHPDVMTDRLRARIASAIFFQRPTYWRLSTLGTCRLEPDAALIAKSSWAGQQFVMLQTLNSLRLSGGNARPLTGDERAAILGQLSQQKSMTWGGVRKVLKPLWKESGTDLKAKFNFEIGGEKKLPGNVMEADIAAAFGADWDGFDDKDRLRLELDDRLRAIHYNHVGDEAWNARIEIRRPKDVETERGKTVEALIADFSLPREVAETLADITPAPGWLSHSGKAIDRLLPLMENGSMYSEAVDQCYPDHRKRKGGGLDRLPSNPARLPDIRNPTVTRVLTEVRKVVNNVIDAYGKPDRIRIELARDVKLAGKKKQEAIKSIKKNRDERDKARNTLIEKRGGVPSNDDIEKYRLWVECKEVCPYSGDKIGFDDLFSGRYQIEHIFPRSRSLDNRLANKTLCRDDVNRDKGNRSPHEAFGETADWPDMIARAKSILPPKKASRFVAPYSGDIGEDEWAERQLRDTAYAARAARDFLLLLYPQIDGRADPVEPVAGKITGFLRRQWGLNTLLGDDGEKNRGDHRHHAVDAAVVALTNRAFVKRMSDRVSKTRPGRTETFPMPWKSFRADLERSIERVVPSFRIQAKLSGPLHEETRLGWTPEMKGKRRLYVKRKSVAALTPKDIESIRDPAVQALVKRCVSETGSLKAAVAAGIRMPLRGVAGAGPEVKSVRVTLPLAENAVIQLSPKPKTFAELGAVLHHIALYNAGNKIEFETVTRPQITERVRQGLPPIVPKNENGATLLYALHRNDILEEIDEHGVVHYWLVRKFNQEGRVFYKPVTMAGSPEKEVSFGPSAFLDGTLRKVSIDPIGRIRKAK